MYCVAWVFSKGRENRCPKPRSFTSTISIIITWYPITNISIRHWVRPHKCASDRAPHMLRPALLRCLRATTQSLIAVATDRPVSIPTSREQTWQDSASPDWPSLWINSLSAVVQWVFCKTMMNALFLWASYSISWSCLQWTPRCSAAEHMIFGYPRQQERCCAWNKVLPSPRRTHPAQVAVAARVATGLKSISRNTATGRTTWKHLLSFLFAIIC